MTLKETSNHKGKFFVVQFSELRENTLDEKETCRTMFFQFASRSIDQTFEVEKKLKEEPGEVI
jgi:hypothetical protein